MLVYTWSVEPQTMLERMTVRFEHRGDATEVTVRHERITERVARDQGVEQFLRWNLPARRAKRLRRIVQHLQEKLP